MAKKHLPLVAVLLLSCLGLSAAKGNGNGNGKASKLKVLSHEECKKDLAAAQQTLRQIENAIAEFEKHINELKSNRTGQSHINKAHEGLAHMHKQRQHCLGEIATHKAYIQKSQDYGCCK